MVLQVETVQILAGGFLSHLGKPLLESVLKVGSLP